MLKVVLKTDIPQQIRFAITRLDERLNDLLLELGHELLSLQQKDFQTKSNRGVGVDGTKWHELSPITELRKSQKRLGQFVENRIRKRLAKARKDKDAKKYAQIAGRIRKQYSIAQSQIGVDTGLMRNSASPGFRGPDGLGGNIFSIQGRQVTVGYGREYAKFFDEGSRHCPARPLMPDVLPKEWSDRMDKIVADWIGRLLEPLS